MASNGARFHNGVEAAQLPYPPTQDCSNGYCPLRARVTLLMQELAQALSDKAAAEHATQYILRISAATWQGQSTSSGSGELGLSREELRSLSTQLVDIKKNMDESVSLSETLKINLNQLAPLQSSSSGTTSGILIDLDDDTVNHRCASSDDDFDKLKEYSQTLPKMVTTSEKRSVILTPEGTSSFSSLSDFDLPVIRRFVKSSNESSTQAEESGLASSIKTHEPTATAAVHDSGHPSSMSGGSKPTDFKNRIRAARKYPTRSSRASSAPRTHENGEKSSSEMAAMRQTYAVQVCTPQAQSAPTPQTSDVAGTVGIDAANSNSSDESTSGPTSLENPVIIYASNAYNTNSAFKVADPSRSPTISLYHGFVGCPNGAWPNTYPYGIRYQPAPDMADTFKMLSITNLPASITLAELLGQIRGGAVVSCQLLNTTSITGSFSALVRFEHENSALAYDDFAAAHPVLFHGQRAQIQLVKTASWPLPKNLHLRLGPRVTRCLEIRNLPGGTSPEQICVAIQTRPGFSHATVEHCGVREGGTVDIRFSSVYHAVRAAGILRGCDVRSAEDPCTLPLWAGAGAEMGEGLMEMDLITL